MQKKLAQGLQINNLDKAGLQDGILVSLEQHVWELQMFMRQLQYKPSMCVLNLDLVE